MTSTRAQWLFDDAIDEMLEAFCRDANVSWDGKHSRTYHLANLSGPADDDQRWRILLESEPLTDMPAIELSFILTEPSDANDRCSITDVEALRRRDDGVFERWDQGRRTWSPWR